MITATGQKKLAFITPRMSLCDGGSLGIRKKVQGQIRAFERLGYRVGHFGIAPFIHSVKNLPQVRGYYHTHYREILEQLKEFGPDAVYIRYGFCDGHFIRFLKALQREVGAVPVYLEIATYPYDRELRSGNPGLLALHLNDLVHRRKLRKHIDRIVTFSDYEEIFGIPTVKIGNGVDTEALPPASAHGESNCSELHFIGVSNLAFWTGYDRLIEGMADYGKKNGRPEVVFNVVGEGPGLEPLRRIVERKGMEQTVILHGAQSGEALDALFHKSRLAIGNLGVHRKGMAVNPDLKNREYCARGIPFITSTRDPGFPADFPFILPASPDDTPIRVQYLIDFIERLRREHSGYGETMREYARKNLDWSVMLAPVAEAFEGSR